MIGLYIWRGLFWLLLSLFVVCCKDSTGLSQLVRSNLDSIDSQVGISILVVKDGYTLIEEQRGYADIEREVPLDESHLFRIGSITKTFTSVVILKIAEDGQLGLEDPLSTYIPDYPNGDSISLKQLLNHTSGIKSYTGMEQWADEVRRRDFTVNELIDYFKDEPIDFAPGTNWKYNDSGYILLGKVIEEATGNSYSQFLGDILQPHDGVQGIQYDDQRRIIKNRSLGYSQQKGELVNAPFLSMTQPYAAGSLLANARQLCSWFHLVFKTDFLTESGLSLAMDETIINDHKFPYGLGWQIDFVKDEKALYHHGWINGFFTTAWFVPGEDLFVTVLSNCTCYDPRPLAKSLINGSIK